MEIHGKEIFSLLLTLVGSLCEFDIFFLSLSLSLSCKMLYCFAASKYRYRSFCDNLLHLYELIVSLIEEMSSSSFSIRGIDSMFVGDFWSFRGEFYSTLFIARSNYQDLSIDRSRRRNGMKHFLSWRTGGC